MADIAQEIETLRDFVVDLNFARIWMQHVPEKYAPNELSIRYIGDGAASETGYHFRLDRDYQFVYFGANDLACIQKATEIQRKIRSKEKIRIKDSEAYLTLGPFSFSQPFKAEGENVVALIGVLQAQVREAREFEQVPKMGEINADITRKEGD